jgi:hypothetical protein
MATKLDPEFEAEIRELLSLKNLLPDPPPPPRPKPKLAVENIIEPNIAAQRERFERVCERLMIAEKRAVKEWLSEARHRDALRRERDQLAWQQRVDAWVLTQRQIEAHQRWMDRNLDPTNSGIYGVEPCHRNRGDK